MIDLTAPDLAVGALVLALTIFYAAWHEYRLRNPRDAKLLLAVGALGLMGSAAAWVP
ncbi:hypothetical protein [Rhodoferax lacus]|uniref:hypothetical protein n=1 Tax=Rhodoferax lacus TaxID=2184758 RepID=UPI0013148DB0|nr:hypothetical protein [Rhodoferax lacus]